MEQNNKTESNDEQNASLSVSPAEEEAESPVEYVPEAEPTASQTGVDETPCEDLLIAEAIPPRKRKSSRSSRLKGKKYLAFCFAVPVFVLFFIYVFMGVYPFGGNSVLVLDLNGQYVYYFEALRDIITGGGSLLYSFSRALGGEFMGIFSYYLASPLNFIILLFPKDAITEALFTLILLKCGLSGFTFGLYAHKTRPRNPVPTVMFSCMWSLCAFCVVMQHNLMWTDCIILLPVVMMGIERLIIKGRGELFVISLSVAVISNFYIGYMMCIFSAVYFFCFYFSKSSEEINPSGEKAHFPKRLARAAVCAVLVVCICAVILLTTYYSLSFGKTTFSDPSYIFEQKNDFLDILSKLFFGSYDTVRPEGLPFLYTGTLTLFLFPLFFIARKVTLREKISYAILVLILFLSMNASTVDLFWHGMQKPNWLNYRYSFMLCFFLVFLSLRAFEEIREISFKYIMACGAAIAVFVIIMQKQDYENMPDLSCIWATLGFCLVYILALRGCHSLSAANRSVACICLCMIICFEMFSSGLLNLYSLDNDVVYSNRASYRDYIDKLEVPVNDIKESDTSFYRMEKTTHRKTNDNMALGIYGLSNSTSTLNAKTIKLLNRFGFASKSHWSKYLGATELSDSLLGIKYVISESETADEPLYNTVKEYEEEGLTTFENPYALSVAYGVSPSLTNSAFEDDETFRSPFERMNELVSCMRDGDGDDIFRPVEISETSTSNVSAITTASHLKYSKVDTDSTASVTFYVDVDSSDPLYCYFPSDYTREVKLYLNGESIGTYYGNETYRIIKLGSFEAGETIALRMELEKDELYIYDGGFYFYTLNSDSFTEAMADLSECQLNVTSYTDSTLSGTITVTEGKTQIFTSIPYDEGWQITVDGERISYSSALDALITFELSEGEHTVEMKYMPNCFTVGAAVSVCGVCAFVMLETAEYLIRRKKKYAPRSAGGENI